MDAAKEGGSDERDDGVEGETKNREQNEKDDEVGGVVFRDEGEECDCGDADPEQEGGDPFRAETPGRFDGDWGEEGRDDKGKGDGAGTRGVCVEEELHSKGKDGGEGGPEEGDAHEGEEIEDYSWRGENIEGGPPG